MQNAGTRQVPYQVPDAGDMNMPDDMDAMVAGGGAAVWDKPRSGERRRLRVECFPSKQTRKFSRQLAAPRHTPSLQ